jgi:hypothetical protein
MGHSEILILPPLIFHRPTGSTVGSVVEFMIYTFILAIRIRCHLRHHDWPTGPISVIHYHYESSRSIISRKAGSARSDEFDANRPKEQQAHGIELAECLLF